MFGCVATSLHSIKSAETRGVKCFLQNRGRCRDGALSNWLKKSRNKDRVFHDFLTTQVPNRQLHQSMVVTAARAKTRREGLGMAAAMAGSSQNLSQNGVQILL